MLAPVLGLVLGGVALAFGVTCNPPYEPIGGQCLYVNAQAGMTWDDARDYCRSVSGSLPSDVVDLASFSTCDSYAQLARYLDLSLPFAHELWVGGHSHFTPNMWEWVSGDSLQTGAPYWSDYENYDSGENCAYADGLYYYRLSTGNCNSLRGFVCSDAPVKAEFPKIANDTKEESCHHDSIQVGEYCYVFKKEYKTWSEAEHNCEEDHHHQQGGMLYYPDSCDEYAHLTHHLEAIEDTDTYWVGAIDISGYNEWTWSDGGNIPSGVPFWATGKPSHTLADAPRQHCGVMDPDLRYYLKDVHCSDRHHFICKIMAE